MTLRRLAVATLAAAALLLLGPAVADANPRDGIDAVVLGNVTIDPSDPTKATFRARYLCTGGSGALWVSVKQAEGGAMDTRLSEEHSSRYAAAWSHSHRNLVVCDGEWHTTTFSVDQLEWGWGELTPGQGWVQFCLGDGSDAFTSSSRWAAVR